MFECGVPRLFALKCLYCVNTTSHHTAPSGRCSLPQGHIFPWAASACLVACVRMRCNVRSVVSRRVLYDQLHGV